MPKNKDFEILIENLLLAYRQFYLNKIMHKKLDGKPYEKFLSTWNTILLSLEEGYLLGLAKVFGRPKELEETISIYSFLDHKLEKHTEVIEKIKLIRNKMLAHLDAKTMRKREQFLKENGLKSSDIESLFATAIEVVNHIKNSLGFDQDLHKVFVQTKKEVREEFNKLYTKFQKGFQNN